MFAGKRARTRMHTALKLIKTHTCIKFRPIYLAALNTSTAPEFAVVFRNRGNRYVSAVQIIGKLISTNIA